MNIHGGHAIMLKVQPSMALINVTKKWVEKQPTNRQTMFHKSHCTIAFIGRNMDESVGERMKTVAESVLSEVPSTVQFNGRTTMFGGKKDHLVAILEKTEELIMFRGLVVDQLKQHGVKISTSFGFTPHITLGLGKPRDYGIGTHYQPIPLEVESLQLKIGPEYFEWGGDATSDELHPTGRCLCAGEGTCSWCLLMEGEDVSE